MSSKLGYTWYSQDYISDPEVMMMTPAQRGIYRDLIDLAYKHENRITYTLNQLSRYTNASEDEVREILEIKGENCGDYWSIPSCQKRIDKALISRENGAKGGRPKKPRKNPEQNPQVLEVKTQSERQREIESKREREIEKKEKGKYTPLKPPKGESRPQSVEDVCEYFRHLGLNGRSEIEAEKFFDHYTANGWKVGKNPMKDWKATARNWKRNVKPEKKKNEFKF